MPTDPASLAINAEEMTVDAVQRAPLLRYPLQRQDDYGAAIKFQVKRISDVDTSASSSATAEDRSSNLVPGSGEVKAGGDGFDYTYSGTLVDTALQGKPAEETTKRIPFSNPVRGRIPDDDKIAELFLPAGLSYNDGVSYDNINISGSTELIAGFVAGGGDVKEALAGGMDFLNRLKNQETRTEAGKLLMSKATSAISEDIGGALSGNLRVKANPNSRMLFGSVPIRSFEFGFTFLPASLTEAETIINIIKMFREELYPEGIAEYAGRFHGYNYPDVFDIQFLYKGKEMTDAPKLLDCYLQGVQTNYNPNQMAFFKDGKFSEITMALSFVEERALFRQDVQKGF